MSHVDLRTATAHCEDVTRSRARNFHWGIRLLPAERRAALSAVYALARRIDDIGDGDVVVDDPRAALERCRGEVEALRRGERPDPRDPVLVAVGDAAGRFPVPLDAFGDLIDGVLMDLDGAAYLTWEELVVYCRRVAGSIGRLCVGVFGGVGDERAWQHADDLGVALQLTNILRDVREDAARGRTYLPDEALVAAGADPAVADARFDALVHDAAARARTWYARGWQLLPHLDRRSAACVRAMAGIYARLLARIDEQPARVLHERVSLPTWEKSAVAIRSLTGIAP